MKKNSLPPLKFLEGEIIWAKYGRRPWWPCEVMVDPVQGIYHKVKGELKHSGLLLLIRVTDYIWLFLKTMFGTRQS